MEIFDIRPMLSLGFWFKTAGEPFLPIFQYALFGLFTILFVLGLVSGIIFQKKKEVFILRFAVKYLKNWFLWAGIAGYSWMFFTYERAIFLSSRFWILAWLIGFGIWLWVIIRKIMRLPKKQEELRGRAQFEKYLPKKRS